MKARLFLLALFLVLVAVTAFTAGFVHGCRDGYRETETTHEKAQR